MNSLCQNSLTPGRNIKFLFPCDMFSLLNGDERDTDYVGLHQYSFVYRQCLYFGCNQLITHFWVLFKILVLPSSLNVS